MVERAVPGVWQVMSPDAMLDRRLELMGQAFERIFGGDGGDGGDGSAGSGGGPEPDTIEEAAHLAREAVAGLDHGARVLSAAVAAQPWPNSPALQLWHASTIWREYRGDSHNIALADAELDGVECHVLMAARGHGNQATIEAIRGWTAAEWCAAVERLRARGLVDEQGQMTASGAQLRSDVECATDRLSTGPVENLGPERAARLHSLADDVAAHLVGGGHIAGTWPPPSVQR
jgi:hypothetical protein